jgi:hypothetical protein
MRILRQSLSDGARRFLRHVDSARPQNGYMLHLAPANEREVEIGGFIVREL